MREAFRKGLGYVVVAFGFALASVLVGGTRRKTPYDNYRSLFFISVASRYRSCRAGSVHPFFVELNFLE
jgi:hypothetical protein